MQLHAVFPEHLDPSQELALAALSSLPDASVMVLDRSLRIVLADGGVLRDAGLNPVLMEGRELADVLPAPAYAELAPRYLTALSGERSCFDQASLDGERMLSVEVSPARAEDGTIVGVTVISRDVTDRRRLERSVATGEETAMLAAAVAAAPGGMALVSIDGRVIRADASVCLLLGRAPGDLVGERFLDLVHPDERADDEIGVVRLVLDAMALHERDSRLVRADGRPVDVRLRAAAAENELGVPSGYAVHVSELPAV